MRIAWFILYFSNFEDEKNIWRLAIEKSQAKEDELLRLYQDKKFLYLPSEIYAIFKRMCYCKSAIIGYQINDLIIREEGRRDNTRRSSNVAIRGWAHRALSQYLTHGIHDRCRALWAATAKEYLRICAVYLTKNTRVRVNSCVYNVLLHEGAQEIPTKVVTSDPPTLMDVIPREIWEEQLSFKVKNQSPKLPKTLTNFPIYLYISHLFLFPRNLNIVYNSVQFKYL